jgi:hypothetical protein
VEPPLAFVPRVVVANGTGEYLAAVGDAEVAVLSLPGAPDARRPGAPASRVCTYAPLAWLACGRAPIHRLRRAVHVRGWHAGSYRSASWRRCAL